MSQPNVFVQFVGQYTGSTDPEDLHNGLQEALAEISTISTHRAQFVDLTNEQFAIVIGSVNSRARAQVFFEYLELNGYPEDSSEYEVNAAHEVIANYYRAE